MRAVGSSWPAVPLKKVLKYLDERVEIDDLKEYATITVKRRHGGLEERERLFGHQIKTKKQFRLVPGSFIISRVQCWHQAYALVPDDLPSNMIASTNYDQFAICPEVDSRFFWWLSHSPSFTETVRNSASGVVIEKMVFDRDAWLEKTVPLPPLSEQRRIVGRIEELAAMIEEARGLRGHSRQELAELTVREATQCFASVAKHTVLIGQAFRVTTGGTPSRSYPAYWGGSIPWVSSGEVAFCRIRDTREKITELGEAESNAKRYPPNTILIAMIGQGKTRGQCAILDCEAATNQNVAGIHVYETQHVPEYVYHWLVARYLESRSAEIGTAQPALSGQRVRKMPIPLPLVEEQHRIVAYLNTLQAKVDTLKDLQAQTADELNAMLPSILDKTFKGDP